MNLDAKTFESIVKALRADDRKGSERRVSPRAGLSARIFITPVKAGDVAPSPVEVHLRDLSVTGLGLLSVGGLRAGSLFVVELPRQDDESLAILCRVMHDRPVSGRYTQIGAKLVKVLTQDELQRALMGMTLEYSSADSKEPVLNLKKK